MKGRRDATPDFRVPLTSDVKDVINQARLHARHGYLFPSTRSGVISDATMSRLMERREMEARPHGFRTSLRSWLEDSTDASFEVKEACISHIVGGAVERAYRRTDYLDQRSILMERWAQHVTRQTWQFLKLEGGEE